MTPEQMDVIAVRDLLRDKNRPLLLGDQQFAAGALFAGAWTKLVWHLNEGAWLPLAVTHTFGGDERATVRYYAACGGSFAMRWFGNPWWSTAIMAWADANPPPTPGDIALAVEAANELDERGIVWLIEGTYSTQFLDAIHQWQRAHGADDKQQAALGLFPPGVPELPASMTTQQPSSP